MPKTQVKSYILLTLAKIAYIAAPCRKLKAVECFLKSFLTLLVKMISFKLKIDTFGNVEQDFCNLERLYIYIYIYIYIYM